ncbi:LysR family transcriptional regulator [Pseudomonas guariconensis]|uniref:LysR family transcriptional regulator n=1 Tax=Pseudomonas guariconensis TaxID=1288410 RepID=UPI0018AB7AC2|nr:LysR family transcriptional regulator [Pseudomonas guariconensis]MBF8741395.1 LysR family transcriptional regulator [Pseudomonas guariconensis]MBF8749021.1 LysR family transcriptional regulator [Pseudomonas guariconensis]
MPYASMQSIALRYFLEVVRSGSVNEASLKLNVAASAVSRQIAKLEYELGTPLFERRARGMLPTAAGEMLAGHARKAQMEVGQLLEELGQLQGLRRGHVRLACSQGFAVDFLPDAIATFRQAHEGITFTLDVTSPGAVSQQVREGQVDLGLTYSLAPEENIAIEHAIPGAVMAIVPAGHPLSGQGPVALAQLQPYPIALPMPETTARRLFDICCGVQGLEFNIALECNYMATLYRFVAEQGGVSLSNAISNLHYLQSQQIVALPFTDETLQARRIELQSMAGRQLPQAVVAFRDHLVARMPS